MPRRSTSDRIDQARRAATRARLIGEGGWFLIVPVLTVVTRKVWRRYRPLPVEVPIA